MSDQPVTGLRTLAVVGIGRLGPPLAISFAEAVLKVVGVDRDPDHVDKVNAGILTVRRRGR